MPTATHPLLQVIVPAVAAIVGIPESLFQEPPSVEVEELRYAKALCFYLLYVEHNRTHQCIAKLFQCNESTVRRSLHRMHLRLSKSAATRNDLLQIQARLHSV